MGDGSDGQKLPGVRAGPTMEKTKNGGQRMEQRGWQMANGGRGKRQYSNDFSRLIAPNRGTNISAFAVPGFLVGGHGLQI
jgi:hypothetical protein